MNKNAAKAAFDSLLKDTGITLQKSTAEVVAYTETRAAHLSAIADQEGFSEALAAEARNVGQFAGISAAYAGDATDSAFIARFFGLLIGLLAAGA